MKTVDEVYPIDINTTIGPTGTIKRLFQNRSFFADQEIGMSIFVAVPVRKKVLTYKYHMKELVALPGEKNSGIMADTINAKGWRNSLKSKIKESVKRSRWMSAYRINKTFKDNRALMEHYLSMKRNPEIVIFHEVDSCYNYCKLAGPCQAKSVMFIHADGSSDGMLLKSFPKLAGTRALTKANNRFQYAIEHCDRIVFITKGAKQVFCSQHPEVNPNKVVAFVNGIDNKSILSTLTVDTHKYRLCTTGSVCERKGQRIIVEALNRLDRKLLNEIHLSIIGTGPDFQKIHDLVSDYSLEANVTLWGNVPNSQVHELLCKENIFILMSNNEGLPISILEAMRAGLPVISTKIAGIPEEVDNRNGILIDPDIDQLTEVLSNLSQYDWKALGENSRKRFESEFTFDIMKQNYSDMINGIQL